MTGRELLDRISRIRGQSDHRYRDELVERFGVDLDRPTGMLPTSNAQKIGLVMAFAHRPELLILDEAVSDLDPPLRDEFSRLVRETAHDGRTVLLCTHDLEMVQRLVDRFAILHKGRIVASDSVERLRVNAPQTIEFGFAEPVDPGPFQDLSGVRVLSRDGARLQLSVTGPVDELLRVAAEHHPIDITARSAVLDELFADYRSDMRTTAAT